MNAPGSYVRCAYGFFSIIFFHFPSTFSIVSNRKFSIELQIWGSTVIESVWGNITENRKNFYTMFWNLMRNTHTHTSMFNSLMSFGNCNKYKTFGVYSKHYDILMDKLNYFVDISSTIPNGNILSKCFWIPIKIMNRIQEE